MSQPRPWTARAAVARRLVSAAVTRARDRRAASAGPWRGALPDRAAEVEADAFREAMSAFPAPVSVVTAMDAEGEPRGLTCSAVASLSLEPPTLLVCVNQRNGSLQAIRGSAGFTVNLLRQGRDEVSREFASPSTDKFASVSWRPSPVSGLPWLHRDTLAFVDCRLVGELAVGSHAVLIGLARLSRVAGDATGTEDGGALLYWRRAYGRWSAQAPPPLAAVPALRTDVKGGNGSVRTPAERAGRR